MNLPYVMWPQPDSAEAKNRTLAEKRDEDDREHMADQEVQMRLDEVHVMDYRPVAGAAGKSGAPGGGTPPEANGAPPEADDLLRREPVLLDEGPELLCHLSGSDRLPTHDRLQRFGPAAELHRVPPEVLLTGHPSPPPRICAH